MRCSAHSYERVKNKSTGTVIYKCQKCPHWCTESQVIGRSASCRYCDNTFIMNREVLLKKPHCGCKFKKRAVMKEKVDESAIDDLIALALGEKD